MAGFQISEPEIWGKIALSADFQGFSWKFRPLKNIFRTLENGHSIRHQFIPPLSAGRDFCVVLYKNCRVEVANPFLEGADFTFWRVPIYILEAEIVLGLLYGEWGETQKGWYFGFP